MCAAEAAVVSRQWSRAMEVVAGYNCRTHYARRPHACLPSVGFHTAVMRALCHDTRPITCAPSELGSTHCENHKTTQRPSPPTRTQTRTVLVDQRPFFSLATDETIAGTLYNIYPHLREDYLMSALTGWILPNIGCLWISAMACSARLCAYDDPASRNSIVCSVWQSLVRIGKGI